MEGVNVKDGFVTGLGGQFIRKLTEQKSGLPALEESGQTPQEIEELQRPACVLMKGGGE